MEQRPYPWGGMPPDDTLTLFCPQSVCPTIPANVGSFPAGNGRFGQSDLGGNIWEKLLDNAPGATNDPCDDCVILNPAGGERMVEGGGFDSGATYLATDFVGSDVLDHRDKADGFRCARPP